MKFFCSGICIILTGVAVLAVDQTNMKIQADANTALIGQMGALNDEERIELVEQLIKERIHMERNLIRQLDNSKTKQAKFAVAFLLGYYRMEKSVPHLSKLITLEAQGTKQKRENLWDRYPVVEALIRIGNPAIPEMIRNIETSEDNKVRELSARVIRYVEGAEIGRIVIEKAIEKQTDPRRKARLEAALKYCETLEQDVSNAPK
jgi:hypothetical protein